MELRAPPSDLISRFRKDVTGLAPGFERLGIAVSGGPDSLALLLLARAAFPDRIEAATIDHGLRAESAIEALHVEDICARLGCPHSIIDVTVPDGPSGIQAEARGARYDALRRWAEQRGLMHLATAHHADDQAETVMMRLQRGSGVGGLAGIRPRRPAGRVTVIRPLLDWTKAELVHLVASAGIAAADDPSNRDERFDRAAMRRFLQENPRFEPQRLGRTASAAREADEALEWMAEQLAVDRLSSHGGDWRLDPSGLPREIQRRLLARTIAAIREEHALLPPWTGNEDVEGLLTTLLHGGTATLAGVMARGGTCWRLRLAPPRRPTG